MRTRLFSLTLFAAPLAALLICLVPSAASADSLPTGCSLLDPTSCHPTVAVASVPSSVTGSSAMLNGSANPEGLPASCQYQYGTTKAYGTYTAPRELSVHQSDPVLIGGLSPSTKYHFRLTCFNTAAVKPQVSKDVTFLTAAKGSGTAPVVSTTATTLITALGASLNGTVTAGSTPTTCFFTYTNAQAGTTASAPVSVAAGAANTTVTIPVGQLVDGQNYTDALVCSDAGGSATGASMGFQTEPITTAPQALTGYPSTLSNTSATLYGTANGVALGATCHYEYGTTTGYGSTAGSFTIGSNDTGDAPEVVTAPVTGLAPSTTYHYDLYCKNGQGVPAVQGGDVTFTTTASGTPPILPAAVSHPSVSSRGFAKGYVTFAVKCGFGTACVGRVGAMSSTPTTGNMHGTYGLGSNSFIVPAGYTKAVRLKLPINVTKYLNGKHHKVKITINLRDSDKRTAHAKATLT